MFLKKRKYTYQDFLNNNTQTKKPMNKPETMPKIQTLLNKKSHMAINFNLNTLFNNSIQQFTKKTEFNYNILINDTYFMDNIMARIFNLILSTNSLKLKIIGLNI